MLPLPIRRRVSEARLRAKVRRGELVCLHVHYPHHDVSPAKIEDDARLALEAGLAYAEHIAALLGRAAGPFPDLRGLRVLEVGPGLAFGPLLVCRAAGAIEVGAVDVYPVGWHEAYHPAYYRRFCEMARQRWPGGDWSAAQAMVDSNGGAVGEVVRVIAGDIAAGMPNGLEHGSFDATVSNATLEHVIDLAAAVRQLARLTRLGGAGVHLVDFRHHCDPERPLAFLTIPDRRYERVLARRQGREGNRVRASELAGVFAEAGLEVVGVDVIDRADRGYVDRLRPRMLARFAAMDAGDLAILSARFRVRRV